MSTNSNVNAGTRLVSMFLDHLFMSVICVIFFIPTMISTFSNAFAVSHEPQKTNGFEGPMLYIALVGFALYFCKDCIHGRSIAKRMMKLQVVNNSTGEAASSLRCFVRNIFCLLWPIEVIVTLGSPSRRLGDLVAGTKVVDYNATVEQQQINFTKLLVPVALSYGLMLLFVVPLKARMPKLAASNYIEGSYNESESKALEKLYADSLGQYMKPSVRVYDKVQKQDVKYISVICELKENYLEDDDSYKTLSEALLNETYSMFPKNTFTGQAQYVFSTTGSMQKRTVTIGKMPTYKEN